MSERMDWESENLPLKAQEYIEWLENIKTAVEQYLSEGWHHPGCPRDGGNDYPACNCGYSDLLEALDNGR